MIYALAHFTKLKPTIDPVKCHYIKAEEITQFHQRNQMISENAWNALMRIGGSIYKLYTTFTPHFKEKRMCISGIIALLSVLRNALTRNGDSIYKLGGI